MIQPPLRALWLVPLVLLPCLASPSYAGIFFGKKGKKSTPAERVPELLAVVKSDGDESKRAAAAQELRQYDPAQFPMVIPVLVDVMLTDGKPGVRAEAAQSLGKIRPISQQAGIALEQALNNDSSMRVRLQARSSLLQYHWSGYHSTRKEDLVPQTKEPPLADEKVPPVISTTTTSLPTTIRPAPRLLPDGSRTRSGYRPQTPAPRSTPRTSGKEPPVAPIPVPSPQPSSPQSDGNQNGPELTPP